MAKAKDSGSQTGISLLIDQLQLPAHTQATWITCTCGGESTSSLCLYLSDGQVAGLHLRGGIPSRAESRVDL